MLRPESLSSGSFPETGKKLAHPVRFERTTFGFGGQHSIQLSYGCLGGRHDKARAAGRKPTGVGQRALRRIAKK